MDVTPAARRCAFAALLLLVAAAARAVPPAATAPDYRLDLRIDPAAQSLEAEVGITLGPERAGRSVEFLLARPLEIIESRPAVEPLPFDAQQGFHGINGSSTALAARGAVARYRVQLAPGEREIRLRYRGRIDFPLDAEAEQYTRGFRETPGLISKEGIYLGGSTLWYPYFGEELVTFELRSEVPEGWQLIAQGSGVSRDAQGRALWRSGGAMDEIDLVGGPLTLYSQPAGAVEAQVYLRRPDEPLARRYLTATAQYLEMYRRLIGPYPYGKFALVENFWETGYGMPSFTLLGSQIIRFPFILTSSYPHEILHNWWGNSVFVDYASGNWCEGLTAYLADHLLKEQVGQGLEFRRDTLKKYRDFVKEGRDFPLTAFRSRHSAATEAVGYGKTLMLFHMLRLELGDDAFRSTLARFYRERRGQRAGFDDLRAVFEQTSGRDLGGFFAQWVQRTGAPQLALEGLQVARAGDRYRLHGRIVQKQAAAPYALTVPLYVTTAEGPRIEKLVVNGRRTELTIEGLAQPLLVEADPEFDLFRLLDARETAPSIGQIFGEPEILAVLPSRAAPAMQAAYRRMLESWRSASHRIEIASDAALARLPPGRAAWILGRENLLAARLFGMQSGTALRVSGEGLNIGSESIPFAGHSAVVVERHPGDVTKAIGWIVLDPPEAAEGLARKLPHYGKYSWLGFTGVEPENSAKGEWPATDSPLRIDLRPAGARAAPIGAAARPKRAPLAELPSIFSAKALRERVEWLAAPGREGRGAGTRGLEAAADYIARQFEAAGLAPGGADGSFFQSFRLDSGPDGRPVELRNVVGVLYPPGGANAARAPAKEGADVVLITAHYDHLGFGWPEARSGEAGRRHPGADDNASGVAVLLELAKAYAAAGAPARPLVFLATTAEEAGLRGARHYLGQPTPFPRERLRAAVNMDTVGRLGTQEIQVLAAGSAREWPHIFRGIGFTTGIALKSVADAAASSDQQAFIERGIPAVQIFTGAHLDYHRSSDTADRIDAAGMVKVATVVQEAVNYLLERPEPLTATIEAPGSEARPGSGAGGAQHAPGDAAPVQRRVSLGTVPDFAFAGPGVRVASVVPDSPAAAAGIAAGDVIAAIDGQAISSLQAYADFLKTRAPGAIVRVSLLRGAERLEKSVTLAAR